MQIEKNIPIPEKQTIKSIIEKMSIGDSVKMPITKRPNVYMISDFLKIKIITKKIDDENIRVWRVK